MMTSRLAFASVVTVVVGLAACGGEDPSVSVQAEGFTAEEGVVSHWVLTDLARDEVVGVREIAVEDGGFEFAVGGVEEGKAYRIDGYFDRDGDGVCHVGKDFAFSFDVAADALDEAGIGFQIRPDTNTAMWEGCRAFGAGDVDLSWDDLVVGRAMAITVIEIGGGTGGGDVTVIEVSAVTGSGDGEIAIAGVVLPERFYAVVVWVDVDQDGECGEADFVARVGTGAVGPGGGGLAVEISEEDAGSCGDRL